MEIFLDGNDIVLRKYESEEKRKEKEIRNKAIDEFIKDLECDFGTDDEAVISMYDLRKLAEEMRGAE